MKDVEKFEENIIGITMKCEAFYFGTVCCKDEILHVVSENEFYLNALNSFTLTDEEFKKYCKFIEPTTKELTNESI